MSYTIQYLDSARNQNQLCPTFNLHVSAPIACLLGCTPAYLCELCHLVSDSVSQQALPSSTHVLSGTAQCT